MQTNDVGNIFQAMRTAYGGQWKPASDAIEVWRRALSRYSVEDAQRACDEALRAHVNHPPTLPQFMALCEALRPRATYLPRHKDPDYSTAQKAANRILVRVLLKLKGVPADLLPYLVQLKNALVEDLGEQPPTKAWAEDVERQLLELGTQ